MQKFVVESCELMGCRFWRDGAKCAKHGLLIKDQLQLSVNFHSNQVCEVRRQLDTFRLEQLLEDPS